MTYNEFLLRYLKAIRNPIPCLRNGQILINLLNEYNTDLHGKMLDVTKSLITIDCFYTDNLIPNTLEWLKENWE